MAEYREDLIFKPKSPLPKKRKEGEDLDGYTLVGERTELVKDEDTREYFLSKVGLSYDYMIFIIYRV